MDMNKISQLLFDLNIKKEGEIVDDYYVIKLDNYNEFNQVYNKLEKSLELERDSNNSKVDEDSAHVEYFNDDLTVELIAIFDEDEYTLNIIEEN